VTGRERLAERDAHLREDMRVARVRLLREQVEVAPWLLPWEVPAPPPVILHVTDGR
jgi:hypothetical protein